MQLSYLSVGMIGLSFIVSFLLLQLALPVAQANDYDHTVIGSYLKYFNYITITL